MSVAWALGSWDWVCESRVCCFWWAVRVIWDRAWDWDCRRRERALRRVEREEEMRVRQDRSEAVWKFVVVCWISWRGRGLVGWFGLGGWWERGGLLLLGLRRRGP